MALSDENLLARVKVALGITGDYQDAALAGYIAEVKSFMLRAGVPQSVADGDEAAGTIARGVADLWTYGPGSAKLSDYFVQRVIQLAARKEGSDA